MQNLTEVTGIVIKTIPVGEYDKVLTILTKERGKITAFARNSRKVNNRFMAGSNPFCFGVFQLYEGRNSYNIQEMKIQNYFDELRQDLAAAYYGMYFLEVADYYTRENNDEKEMLKLLYQSLRALHHESFDKKFVRTVYEIKAMAVNGEFPGVPGHMQVSPGTLYALSFITSSTIEKLYTFQVKEEIFQELRRVAEEDCERIWHYEFKSPDFLEDM